MPIYSHLLNVAEAISLLNTIALIKPFKYIQPLSKKGGCMISKVGEVNLVVGQSQCTWRGSNSQPLDPKSSALSIELQVQIGHNYILFLAAKDLK